MDACSAVAGPSTVPDLVFPASLQKLELRESFEAGLSSLLPQRLQDLRVSGAMISRGPVDGHGVVLSNFAHLQHLSSLPLLPANIMHWPPVGPAYSALTASSGLVRLELCHTNLPADVWPFLFPVGCTLPFLTSLAFAAANGASAWVAPSWCEADISRLVSCCPNVRAVGSLKLEVGLHVSELHKLTGWTSFL
jgi:hypothetical protein